MNSRKRFTNNSENRRPKKKRKANKKHTIIPGVALGLALPGSSSPGLGKSRPVIQDRKENATAKTRKSFLSAGALLQAQNVQISQKDGEHYVEYLTEKQDRYSKSYEISRSSPKHRAYLRSVSSNERVPLLHHPHTNDPIATLSEAEKVSTEPIGCPDDESSYRVNIESADGVSLDHLASVIWVHESELDACVRRFLKRKRAVTTDYPQGTCMKMMEEAYRKVLLSPHRLKDSKPTASGIYSEAGFGSPPGSYSRSIDVGVKDSSKRDGGEFIRET